MSQTALISVILFFLAVCVPSSLPAEIIYHKDGRIEKAKILYRRGGTVWISQPGGASGVPVYGIYRIEDESGEISKYDYESAISVIQGLIRQGFYYRAAERCASLIEMFPDYAPARALRAALNQKLGNFNAACEDYEYLIKNNLADAQVYNDLGVILASRKDFDGARNCFLEAARQKPDLPQIRDNLANAEAALGKIPKGESGQTRGADE